MMDAQRIDAWVHGLRDATTSLQGGGCVLPILVLCRTAPVADALRRAVARAGGIAGIEIATPVALATTAFREHLGDKDVPAAAPRPACGLLERIGDPGARPGLEAHVGGLVRRLRTHLRSGGALADDPTLASLHEASSGGWASDELEEAQSWLLSALEQRSGERVRGPSSSAAYHRVFAVGFGDPVRAAPPAWEASYTAQWLGTDDGHPVTSVSAFERRVLALLGAEPLGSFDAAPPKALPAARVTDPAAEARLAATMLLQARADGREALVLVPDGVTAARLRAAGRRNGAPTGGPEHSALAGHAVSALFRQALPWFNGEPDPAIRAAHLDTVLTSPLCGGHFPEAIRETLARDIRGLFGHGDTAPEAGREARLSAREMTTAIRAARIVEAPLSVWIERVGRFAAEEHKPALRRGALVLAARLQRLRSCVLGEGFEQDMETETRDGPDRGMEGASTLDVGGEKKPPPLAGTLGALRRFLLDCRLRVHEDPVARELLATLREASAVAATGKELMRTLRGSTSSGWTDDGIDVLTYDDYDGRAVDLILLLGVHNKGLTSAPTPDPVLSEAALWTLGEPAGRRRIVYRSLQALRAAANAKQALAIVASRDSTGRAVVPPIQVALDWEAGRAALAQLDLQADRVAMDSYGLGLGGLPETAERGVLVTRVDSEPTAPPQGHPEVSRLALQASAEWYRAGVGAMAHPQVPKLEGEPTLLDLLGLYDPLAPAWLGRWLGDVGQVPWHSTDKGDLLPWSVSSHFVPLTSCLYRFFSERVLRIKEREPASDELDPAEVGNAIHSVFEALNPLDGQGIAWRVDGDARALDAARLDARASLTTTALARFAAVKGQLHLTPTIDAATEGLRGRWERHWAMYVATRVRAVEAGQEAASKVLANLVRAMPGYEPLLEVLEMTMAAWLAQDRKPKQQKWLDSALVASAGGETLAGRSPKDLAALCPRTIPAAETAPLDAFVQGPAFVGQTAALASSLGSFRALTSVLAGSVRAVLTEVPFGDKVDRDDGTTYPDADRLRQATLRLAGRELRVHGQVDRIMVIEGHDGPVLQILDYKTGTPKSKTDVAKGLASLELPQLPVYALVLATLLRSGEAVGRIPAGSVVGAVGYDFVREGGAGGLLDGQLMPPGELTRVESVLSGLAERALSGRWSLVPLVDDAAGKGSWGYPKGRCSLRDASRFEGLPGGLSFDDQETAGTQEGDE